MQTITNFARSLSKKGLPGKSEIASVGEFLCKLLVLLSIIMMVDEGAEDDVNDHADDRGGEDERCDQVSP